MTFNYFSRPAMLLLGLAMAGCQGPPPPTSADAAVRADCRQQVEREYNAQNRVDLTRRDERDFAFAGTYNPGIASRGLGAAFHRDQMVDNCLRASGATGVQPRPGIGPTFSPAAIGGRTSTLNP